jgi:nucleoside-diphosphate-sugar epimerase
MRILFTGGSSFTGFWFIKALHAAGHEVTALFQRPLEEYSDTRGQRVQTLQKLCNPIHGISFGSPEMIELIKGSNWDLFCHHAADVTNYKSPDFDSVSAVANNTRNLQTLLPLLHNANCNHIILTGSVFEQREGAGCATSGAFSPYGLSKGLTYDLFRFYCDRENIKLGKFVIPNPFGPYEEQRFTSFIVKQWLKGEGARCDFPHFVRDNIHVSLLAKAYAHYATNFAQNLAGSHCAPSGYPESQGAFTQRFANEMAKRLQIPCPVEMPEHHPFPEPQVRINTEICDTALLKWSESAAWDELANYYKEHYT